MSEQLQHSRTTVRRLTAAASSAIAAIAVDGPQALDVVSLALVTASGKPIRLDQACARFAHWKFTDERLADEHVMVLVRGPHAVEIHCHGGLAITSRIIEQLQAAGCECVGSEASDWLQLPVNSEGSSRGLDDFVTDASIQAAAREPLQNARTLKASLVWLEQYQGALARDFAELRNLVQEGKRHTAQELCDVLQARARFGMKLLQPWRLTLAGPPNVGKSSLMNALCGAARVLVHHEPGTTRDAIETHLVISDWPIVLTDTAGIRDATETIERLGIETAWERWRNADLGLLVVDATVGWTTQHDAMLAGPDTMIVVVNKIDAVGDELEQTLAAIKHRVSSTSQCMVVTASARREDGVDEIVQTVGSYLDSCRPHFGSGIPFNTMHVQWLEQQRKLLTAE